MGESEVEEDFYRALTAPGLAMLEIIDEQINEFQNILISRRDFILGMSLGILGNVIASYIIEFDTMVFPLKAYGILLRVIIIGSALGYVLYRYWRANKDYEARIRSLLNTRDRIEDRINSIEENYLEK